MMRTCSYPDCDRKHYARGWCNMHYNRWRTHGDPSVKLVSSTAGQGLSKDPQTATRQLAALTEKVWTPDMRRRVADAHRRWTDDELLSKLRDRALNDGGPPLASSLRRPSVVVYRYRFGSWPRAVLAAGMQPRTMAEAQALSRATNAQKERYGRTRQMVTGGLGVGQMPPADRALHVGALR
jgi:hypothetical protein